MIELKSKKYWINKNDDGEEVKIYISSASLAEQISQQGCIIGKSDKETIIHIPAPQEKVELPEELSLKVSYDEEAARLVRETINQLIRAVRQLQDRAEKGEK